jgi:hypothetical protein
MYIVVVVGAVDMWINIPCGIVHPGMWGKPGEAAHPWDRQGQVFSTGELGRMKDNA